LLLDAAQQLGLPATLTTAGQEDVPIPLTFLAVMATVAGWLLAGLEPGTFARAG
jgi:hypothetical protein